MQTMTLTRTEPRLVLMRSRGACDCANPADCDVCLRKAAEFLAEEMRYELLVALNQTTEVYQADLGEDICTLERARELRRMTAAVCVEQYGGRDRPDLVLADFDDAMCPDTLPFPTVRPGEWIVSKALGYTVRALKFAVVCVEVGALLLYLAL